MSTDLGSPRKACPSFPSFNEVMEAFVGLDEPAVLGMLSHLTWESATQRDQGSDHMSIDFP